MGSNPFQKRQPNIECNHKLRIPQIEAYLRLVEYANEHNLEREVGIILPVGCGKTGLITITPFAFNSKRVLVVAPNIKITEQLMKDFEPSNDDMFYNKCNVLDGPPFPEPADIRGTNTNISDLEEADVVITNIQQLQGQDNRWIQRIESDYFDLLLFDEAHHNVAESWELLRTHFPNARIINFTATPMRADGQVMSGRIIYSYPIFRAIQDGYVKRLKAIVLNPTTLKYVRRENNQEVEVTLEEVRKLGEEDSDFRRSIVTSSETLNTIVDASIRELDRIRSETGDKRHKIIASALNFQHCIQVVEAYRARGRRADYVHSRIECSINERVIQRLDNHELDIIVQVRKLGEGFDHPYLSVAAVFSVFSQLSPFVQFVGRIMRVIEQNNPESILNQGTVVFHAGANVANRWLDFQQYSEADQEFFDQLLPLEGLNFDTANELEIEPLPSPEIITRMNLDRVKISSQTKVLMEEIPLLEGDENAIRALDLLISRGLTPEDYRHAVELRPIYTSRINERRAARRALNDQVSNIVGRILNERGINPKGKELDKKYLNRDNYEVIKSTIDSKIDKFVGRSIRERHEFTLEELRNIKDNFNNIIEDAIKEVFNG